MDLNAFKSALSIRRNSLVISTNRAAANWFQSLEFKSPWIFETNVDTASLDLSNEVVGTNWSVWRTGFFTASKYNYVSIQIVKENHFIQDSNRLASTLTFVVDCNSSSCLIETSFDEISSSSLALKSTSSASPSSELLSSPVRFVSAPGSISIVLHLTFWTFLSRICVWQIYFVFDVKTSST